MQGRARWGLLGLAASLAVVGCDRRQPWEITHGAGVPSARPPMLVAEVYEGAECGPCEPAGRRVYCASLARGSVGPDPDALVDGAPYCFMATALDANGEAFAIGCADARAGQEPVRVTLAPLTPGRFLVPSCDTPRVMVDAGPRRDAGLEDAGLDGGLRDAGGADAGPPGVDAGPPSGDAGPPTGTVRVFFQQEGEGTALVFDARTGGLIGQVPRAPQAAQLTTSVGDQVRLEASPAAGWRLDTIQGGGCGAVSPCTIAITRSESVRVVFAPL